MIIAYVILIVFSVFAFSGFLGMVIKKYDTKYYAKVYTVSIIVMMCSAQYIWG